MSFKEFIDHLKTEGQVIKNAPVAFSSFVVIAGFVVFLSVDWHYAGTITEKDATIQADEAKIGDVNFVNEELGALTNAFNISQSIISNDDLKITDLNFRLKTNAAALMSLAFYEKKYAEDNNPDFRWGLYNIWALTDFNRAQYPSAVQNYKMAFDLETQLRHTDEAKTMYFPFYEAANLMVSPNSTNQFQTNLDSMIAEISVAQNQIPASPYEFFDSRGALLVTVGNLRVIKPIVSEISKSEGNHIDQIIKSVEALEKSARYP